MQYSEFLDQKAHAGGEHGFDPLWLPDFLYPFQRSLVEWALRKGRAAIFADCGLGKTPMQLVWAENVVRKTNRAVLVLTPLAVSHQTVREAEKFGVDAKRSEAGEINASLVVTNYQRLHHFDPSAFSGVVLDESSILKSFDGAFRTAITAFMRKMPYRLLCTATAAPNDYIELGTSSEALGELGYMDMLNRFFKNDQNNSSLKKNWRVGTRSPHERWRFKGHAELPFWRWVCSWARAVRRPSDIGFDDTGFALPALVEREHIVTARRNAPGMLFSLPAVGLTEQREERRRTIRERCEKVAEIVAKTDGPVVCWCHMNDEGDLLADVIPDAEQVAGSDSDDDKEARLKAFGEGNVRVLVIKPKIGAWGLNWQHCAAMTFFPSHSYEQYYQAVRRCWRFGQARPVMVDIVTTEGERDMKENLERKSRAADRMFSKLVQHMGEALAVRREDGHDKNVEVPSWLSPTR